jgi:hypothetical protein
MEETKDKPQVRKAQKLPGEIGRTVDLLLTIPNLRLEHIKFRSKKTQGEFRRIIREDDLRKDDEKSSNP